jgi:hypothetical protein
MEHSIAQPVRQSSDPAPSLRATMASAVGGTVGQAIGSRLAVTAKRSSGSCGRPTAEPRFSGPAGVFAAPACPGARPSAGRLGWAS